MLVSPLMGRIVELWASPSASRRAARGDLGGACDRLFGLRSRIRGFADSRAREVRCPFVGLRRTISRTRGIEPKIDVVAVLDAELLRAPTEEQRALTIVLRANRHEPNLGEMRGLCSGASSLKLAISAFTSSSMITLCENLVPPRTMR